MDLQLAALALAFGAVAWILALAGAAFAMRATLLLCFTLLANRPRRQTLYAWVRRRH